MFGSSWGRAVAGYKWSERNGASFSKVHLLKFTDTDFFLILHTASYDIILLYVIPVTEGHAES